MAAAARARCRQPEAACACPEQAPGRRGPDNTSEAVFQKRAPERRGTQYASSIGIAISCLRHRQGGSVPRIPPSSPFSSCGAVSVPCLAMNPIVRKSSSLAAETEQDRMLRLAAEAMARSCFVKLNTITLFFWKGPNKRRLHSSRYAVQRVRECSDNFTMHSCVRLIKKSMRERRPN